MRSYLQLSSLVLAACLLGSSSFALAQTPDPRGPVQVTATKKQQADVLFSEGLVLFQQGTADSLRAAFQKFISASDIYTEIGEKGEVAGVCLMAAGTISNKLGDNKAALDYYNRALELFKAIGNKGWQATTLNNIGELLQQNGDKQHALTYHNLALELRRHGGDKDGEAASLNNIGGIYSSLGDKQQALKFFNDALAIFRATGNKIGEGTTLGNIGSVYDDLGDKQQALRFFGDSLTLRRSIGDRAGEALILNNIGRVQVDLGDRQQALKLFNEALAIIRLTGDKYREGAALNNIGQLYSEIGDKPTALKYFTDALMIMRSVGDKTGEATTLNNIGQVYSDLGDNQRALKFLDDALPIFRAVGDKHGEAMVLNNIGRTYDVSGARQDALRSFNDSLVLFRAIGDKNGEAGALHNMGKIYSDQGDDQQALKYLNDALVLHRQAGNRNGEAVTLNNLAAVYDAVGDKQQALKSYDDAMAIFRAIGARSNAALIETNLMALWAASLGNRKLGILFGKQSVNSYQELRGSITSLDKDLQKSFLGQIEISYRFLANLLIADGQIGQAEQVLAMLKEEEAFSYLRREDRVAKDLMQTVSLTDREKTALARYNELADKITAIGKEFGELDAQSRKYEEGKFPQQARLDALKAQLADATTVFQKFLDELKATFGQKDERVVQVDSSLRNTLKRLNAKKTAVVSTIVGEDKLNLIVTTANTQRAHTIDKPAKEINQLVAEFRKSLTDPRIDPRPWGQKLYDILVKPIEADLKGIDADTILWSLDGTLRYIPVAAIWDKDKGFLAERFSSVVLTLASRDTLGLPVSDKTSWNALGVGVSKPTEGFTALAAVPDELDCIITDDQNKTVSAKPKCTSGVVNGRKLLDEKFTETAFENALGRYPIVHIASHFSLNPGDDKDSFLLLGGGEQKKFTVENLRSVSLTDVELLVLSACNTATPGGEKANGVEIEGFGAVAQKQGAKAVMATLWPVADESTRDMMVRFYQLYDKTDLTKAEAMRRAQMEMLHSKVSPTATCNTRAEIAGATNPAQYKCDPKAPYAHPYYWAPFVLFGNWR